MRLGFLTACMPWRPLPEIASWASANGFASLELAAWPASDRPHTAAHLEVGNAAACETARAELAAHGLEVSALAFYENNLDPRPAVREAHLAHLRKCIDAAAAVGSPAVGTFVGRNPERTIREGMAEAEAVFAPLVEHAGERGVALMIENCVMERWDPDRQVGNLAHTPELWEWIASLGLKLNFDPSHLLWQGIDPVAALGGAREIVAHVHAKDIELFAQRRDRTGWGGAVLAEDRDSGRWWRFRMPGLGDVRWRELLLELRRSEYGGTISIEHEDPVFDGEPERIEAGLRWGRALLAAQLGELR